MQKEKPRKSLARMSDEHRAKIKSVALINALQEHALGDRNMGATQVQAARICLAKTLPDISTVTLAGDSDNPLQTRVSVAWERIDAVKVEDDPKQIDATYMQHIK